MVRNRRGRPRKDGVRYPSGKLRPPEPNQRVIAERTAMLGDTKGALSAAEDPMTLALARGWLTEDEHRAGEAYARAYTASHPHRLHGGLNEAPDAGTDDKRTITQMGDAEIVQAFDTILNSTVMPHNEERQIGARKRYVALSSLMTSTEQSEVFACFCMRSWPQWVIQRVAGRRDTSWERKHHLLVSGLGAIHNHLRARANRGTDSRNVRVA